MFNWRGNAATMSALACATIAVAAAGAFLAATAFTGEYTWVARLGGAGWVFLLSTIVLMPTLMPWVKERLAGTPEPRGEETVMALVKDPVCGMDIEASSAAAKETYQGSDYYFCSIPCFNKFKAEPQSYAAKA